MATFKGGILRNPRILNNNTPDYRFEIFRTIIIENTPLLLPKSETRGTYQNLTVWTTAKLFKKHNNYVTNPALVTVNLFDSDLTTLGVGSVRSTVSEGESEIILSFLIPDDAALGNTDIFVNAFTDWISNGGIPLTPEVSISKEITQ